MNQWWIFAWMPWQFTLPVNCVQLIITFLSCLLIWLFSPLHPKKPNQLVLFKPRWGWVSSWQEHDCMVGEVTSTGKRLGSTCPNRCIAIHVPSKGIFPWIILQSQGTEDKLTQTHPKISLLETLGTYWLWVCVAEPVEEEVGFWFRQIRPNSDLFAFVHRVLFCFWNGSCI